MCTWRWNTCCPAAEPWFQPTLNAAGWSALPSLVITALTAWNSRTVDSSSRSVSVAAWTLGTTNVCPRAAGMTSRKASAPSLSYTRSAGTSPATMRQKRQSLMSSPRLGAVYRSIREPREQGSAGRRRRARGIQDHGEKGVVAGDSEEIDDASLAVGLNGSFPGKVADALV